MLIAPPLTEYCFIDWVILLNKCFYKGQILKTVKLQFHVSNETQGQITYPVRLSTNNDQLIDQTIKS